MLSRTAGVLPYPRLPAKPATSQCVLALLRVSRSGRLRVYRCGRTAIANSLLPVSYSLVPPTVWFLRQPTLRCTVLAVRHQTYRAAEPARAPRCSRGCPYPLPSFPACCGEPGFAGEERNKAYAYYLKRAPCTLLTYARGSILLTPLPPAVRHLHPNQPAPPLYYGVR